MPETQTPVENAIMILRELADVLENEGDIVAHARDASDRTHSKEAFELVSQRVLQAAFSGDALSSLRASINELESR